MIHLAVAVRYEGVHIADALLAVRQPVALGDCEQAAVTFPGFVLSVEPHDGRLWVNGEALELGLERTFTRDAISVELLAYSRDPVRRKAALGGDLRVGIASFALILLAAAWEVASGVATDKAPQVALLMDHTLRQDSPLRPWLVPQTADPSAPVEADRWATYREVPHEP